jgi:hypothetical protein
MKGLRGCIPDSRVGKIMPENPWAELGRQLVKDFQWAAGIESASDELRDGQHGQHVPS